MPESWDRFCKIAAIGFPYLRLLLAPLFRIDWTTAAILAVDWTAAASLTAGWLAAASLTAGWLAGWLAASIVLEVAVVAALFEMFLVFPWKGQLSSEIV